MYYSCITTLTLGSESFYWLNDLSFLKYPICQPRLSYLKFEQSPRSEVWSNFFLYIHITCNVYRRKYTKTRMEHLIPMHAETRSCACIVSRVYQYVLTRTGRKPTESHCTADWSTTAASSISTDQYWHYTWLYNKNVYLSRESIRLALNKMAMTSSANTLVKMTIETLYFITYLNKLLCSFFAQNVKFKFWKR